MADRPAGSPRQRIDRVRAGGFADTRWSLVLRAGPGGDGDALGELLEAYWYPLYAFVRRSGHAPADAEDLTQAFVEHLLERDTIASAQPARGRFRSFLIGSLKNFLSNARRHDRAQKRGGGVSVESIDEERGEQRYRLEPSDDVTPADQFERSWAFALLGRVMERLQGEFEVAGRSELFLALRPRLAGGAGAGGETYAVIAERLGMSESAVTVSVHRARKRYGELLRDEIAQTVADPSEVDDELAFLMAVVAR